LSTAFGAMRMIVTIGWAIYPLGYVFGYLTGGVDANSLNVIYNLAVLRVEVHETFSKINCCSCHHFYGIRFSSKRS
jgi:high-affinity nickel permease